LADARRAPRSTQNLLHPVLALALSPVAAIQPRMLEARVRSVGASEERLDTLVVHDLRAVDLRLEHQALRVHEQVALLSLHLLAAALSLLFSTPVLLTYWLSTTPAVG
jgi:hypothetical protein